MPTIQRLNSRQDYPLLLATATATSRLMGFACTGGRQSEVSLHLISLAGYPDVPSVVVIWSVSKHLT